MDKIFIKIMLVTLAFLLIAPSLTVASIQIKDNFYEIKTNRPRKYLIYSVPTVDDSSITLVRYVGSKNPIIFIHGMGCNHLIYDWDKDHSLATFLNKKGWDVWMLDLRTHDCDGDFRFALGSDREYIDRYWDFANTLLKIDVVTA